mgnify:CR=1 FL=1
MADQQNAQPEPMDADPQETREWIEALDGVIAQEGADRAHFLIEKVIGQAREAGIDLPYSANTEYINTIPVDQQPKYPGDGDMEIKIHSYIRWNAMAMVVRANKNTNVGGHIASFASAAALYDVGFSHFWHAPTAEHGGDLIFFQGHSVPGVYSRAFMLGRLTEEQMDNFRQETGGKGISSYPHPWLMPDFWQFPTVSMGLGPIQAIYQARFMKYLASRGLIDAAKADHVHLVTEGSLGWMARRYCIRRGRPFTTSYHTKFPEYLSARLPVPESWAYAWLKSFHNAGTGTLVATKSLADDLGSRGFAKLRLCVDCH